MSASPSAASASTGAVELEPGELRAVCDPAELPFKDTGEVEPPAEPTGQPRALEALEFGLAMTSPGYNIFVTGPSGTGRHDTLEDILRQAAREREAPGDLIYLFDFLAPERPNAVLLPPGRGEELRREMASFVDEARSRITDAFESESYQERRRSLAQELDHRGEEALAPVRAFAAERSLAVELTPAGIAIIPMTHGHPIEPKQFQHLTERERDEIGTHTEEVQERLPALIGKLAEIQRQGQRLVRELDRDVSEFAIGHLVEELATRFSESAELVEWFDRLTDDVVANVPRFRGEAEGTLPEPMAASVRHTEEQFFGRYEPNVLVSHDGDGGAPVVFETNPTHYNLFGRLDYEATFGAVSTDHRRIRAGAVHRANGGYLILDAAQVLVQPLAWEKLKQTLKAGQVTIENLGAQLTLFPTATLEPEPVDLDLKVVLVGSTQLHAALHELDEDLPKLFKVRADFDVEMPRTEDHALRYAGLVARQARDEGLPDFDAGAVARLVEHGSRLREDQGRLSVQFAALHDVVAEAAHWASRRQDGTVGAGDVDRAIEARIRRSDLPEEKLRAAVAEGTVLIDLDGEQVGQVNGLSVANLGDLMVGRPTRITATVGVGSGELVNIDREIELSGPIHDKGFLILAGFLRERYGASRPLSLTASLVFEQSYGMVEGDSASAAELFALLSGLAETPIRQGVAVTGSVNQHGRIQAIGGVNEKIEGFYDVCEEAGLTGGQGVLIPAANRRNLMLRRDVIEAVGAGRFHVWTAATVDAAIELLTGVPAGRPATGGRHDRGSLHARVEERLDAFAAVSRHFHVSGSGDGRAKG
ncbi:MAG TPA: AAA family ATPase [Solirubrobacterales bacterium]|nr:AAA family ATPase [Solirubrobacterales bacterium]